MKSFVLGFFHGLFFGFLLWPIPGLFSEPFWVVRAFSLPAFLAMARTRISGIQRRVVMADLKPIIAAIRRDNALFMQLQSFILADVPGGLSAEDVVARLKKAKQGFHPSVFFYREMMRFQERFLAEQKLKRRRR